MESSFANFPNCPNSAPFCFLDDGISIPMSYTSYLAPLSSAKLHYEVSQCREPNKGPQVRNKDIEE